MAHAYSHLYLLPTTGLRFFTVYGPYGRPDMAYYKFTQKILNEDPIDVYNNGEMKRDFTYIDDITEGIVRVIGLPPVEQNISETTSTAPYKIYNIGNNNPVTLREFISAIEIACNKKAKENLLPMQDGDVPSTYADIDELIKDISFKPVTNINDGINQFVKWYKENL
jgi:UDP-glucuronate 4-epimerase